MTYTKKNDSQRGFSLIELMIVLVIIAILSAFAIPIYRNYVIRGQVVDAINWMTSMRAQMEQFYQDNHKYTVNGTFTPPSPCNTTNPSVTIGSFTGTCPKLTDSTYTLQTDGSATSLTKGFTYTYDQDGAQGTTLTNSYWGNVTCTTAWITSKGQTCP